MDQETLHQVNEDDGELWSVKWSCVVSCILAGCGTDLATVHWVSWALEHCGHHHSDQSCRGWAVNEWRPGRNIEQFRNSLTWELWQWSVDIGAVVTMIPWSVSSTAPVSGDNSDKQKYLTQTMIIVLSTFQIIDTYQDEGYNRGVERGDLLSWSHVSSVFRDSGGEAQLLRHAVCQVCSLQDSRSRYCGGIKPGQAAPGLQDRGQWQCWGYQLHQCPPGADRDHLQWLLQLQEQLPLQ